ncbi:autotransporter family protein [Bartonella sp. B41]
MIKVFKNHIRLCTFTTAILSLIQNGTGICASFQEEGNTNYVFSDVGFEDYSNRSRRRARPQGYDIIIGDVFIGPVDYNRDGRGYEITYDSLNSDGDRVVGRHGPSVGFAPEPPKLSYRTYYLCRRCISSMIDNQSYRITANNTDSSFQDIVAVAVQGSGKAIGEKITRVTGNNVTISSEHVRAVFRYGVLVTDNGEISLTNLNLNDASTALHADQGKIKVNKGSIGRSGSAVRAIGDLSHVVLNGVKFNTDGGRESFYSHSRAKIEVKGGSIDFKKSHGVSVASGGQAIFDDVIITGNGAAENPKNHAIFFLDKDGAISFKGTINSTNLHGILVGNTVDDPNSILSQLMPLQENLGTDIPEFAKIDIKSSFVTISGDKSHGIYFLGEKSSEKREEKTPTKIDSVSLESTIFSVPSGVAIYGSGGTNGSVALSKSTLSSRHSLLEAKNGASLLVLASSSTLEGGVHVDEASNAKFHLIDNSTWILQQRRSHESNPLKDLSISAVSLENSSINFKKLKSAPAYIYQTLRIGRGEGEVYKVQEGARIYLNTFLNSGGNLDNQKTDRVLIYGDVSGETMIRIRNVDESQGESTGNSGNDKGISIIQVSGNAAENSFQLEDGYVAIGNSPYQYKLYAYGPNSKLGKASSDQRLVDGRGEFWDFRLESGHIDGSVPKPPRPDKEPEPIPPSPDHKPDPSPDHRPDSGIKDVVPQVPTYLLLPNSLFQAGLMRVNHQGKRLETLRIASGQFLKSDENSSLFLRGYGGNYRYSSNLSALKYGYGGDIDYSAVDVGISLQTIESEYNTAFFGVIGSYERLSLQPLDVKYSQESVFNKWSITAYGGMQYKTGFYVDGLFSYGFFKGDVLTRARGKTATLKGKALDVSLTIGEELITKYDGLIFDPHVQVVYQRLQFDNARDIDGFDIKMGSPDQWTVRTGGRLAKTLAGTEEAHVVSLYGKLYLTNNFAEKQFVHFKHAFQLGTFGSSLEAGLGFNAQLSKKFALYGDLIYQHKLTKAGFSGTSFLGGLRYNF